MEGLTVDSEPLFLLIQPPNYRLIEKKKNFDLLDIHVDTISVKGKIFRGGTKIKLPTGL